MKIFAAVILSFLISQNGFSKAKFGPEKQPFATPLRLENSYLSKSSGQSTDFWNLISFYFPQNLGTSCGVASLAVVFSAAQAQTARDSDTQNVTEKLILEKVKVHGLQDRMNKDAKGPKGLTLDLLALVAQSMADTFKLKLIEAAPFHAERTLRFKKDFIERLVANEQNPRDFIIVNFNQKLLTDDADAGHISPIAAYDAKTERVLVLDTDREYYEPYWVSVDQVINAMITRDSKSKKFRGYLYLKFGS